MSQYFSEKPRTFDYQQKPFLAQPLELNGRLMKYNTNSNQQGNNEGAWDNFMARTYQNECKRQPNLNNYGGNSGQNIFPEEVQKEQLIRGESYTNQGSMVDFLNKTGEYDAYFEKKQFNSRKKNEETQEKEIKRQTRGIALKDNDYYSQIESLGYPETYIRPAQNDLSMKTVQATTAHQQRKLNNDFYSQIDQLPGAANYQHNLAISVSKNAQEVNPQDKLKSRCCIESQNSSDQPKQQTRFSNQTQKECQNVSNIDTNYQKVKPMQKTQQFLAQSDLNSDQNTTSPKGKLKQNYKNQFESQFDFY